ncbi:MAG: thiamine phosphate synthase [Bermanella sp.]
MIKLKASVLNISANDPMGLAGIHADIRAMNAMKVHCASVVTATTAQTQHAFYGLNAVSEDALISQLDALAHQDVFSVVKIGLIANKRQAEILLAHKLLKNKTLILDPVLAASSGNIAQNQDRIEGIKLLMPHLEMITPNFDEVLALVGIAIEDDLSLKKAALAFINLGVYSVLIKGGHGNNLSEDYFLSSKNAFYLSLNQYRKEFDRGTGCAMASLIASSLALGGSLPDAVVMAKMQIDAGFKSRYKLDESSGSLDIPVWQDHLNFNPSDDLCVQLPRLYVHKKENSLLFQPCEGVMGLYPVVDRAHWLTTLLPLGINIIQLRIKDLTGESLKQEIQQAIEIADKFNAKLFINDYWEMAIECGAYGVHLGQEDLDDADLNAISLAGLRLGLSSHCFFEVARAKTIKPSYIAFGPIYETQSKDMPWIPQGPNGLRYWRAHLPSVPMVAIGGIHGDRFSEVHETGVESIAMISAITEHVNPVQAAQSYMQKLI